MQSKISAVDLAKHVFAIAVAKLPLRRLVCHCLSRQACTTVSAERALSRAPSSMPSEQILPSCSAACSMGSPRPRPQVAAGRKPVLLPDLLASGAASRCQPRWLFVHSYHQVDKRQQRAEIFALHQFAAGLLQALQRILIFDRLGNRVHRQLVRTRDGGAHDQDQFLA